MITDPFSPAVADLVTGPHTVTASVTATTAGYPALTLDVTGGRLSWQENRSPRVQGEIVCALPDDPTTLDNVLDPLRPVRVAVTIAYTLTDGSIDSHVVADLGLRDRRVARQAQELRLSVASDEALIIDASPVANYGYEGGDGTEPDTVTKSNGPAWVKSVIEALVLPVTPTFVITAPPEPAEWPYGNPRDQWDAITDVADQLDIEVYDAGDRVIRIAPRVLVASESVCALKTGPGGTILSSDAGVSRNDWGNFVAIRYEWTKGNGQTFRQYGTARVTAGPYAVATAGYKNVVEQRDDAASKTAANKAAAAVLRRMLARSRSLTVTAVAAWWVRAGHTITVQLPTTTQQRHIVSSVEYDLEGMTMTIATRLPDTVSIIGE